MARRRRQNRRRGGRRRARTARQSRAQMLTFTGHSYYNAGAGRINITPKKIQADTFKRPMRMTRITLTLVLRSDTGMVPSEPVSVYIWNPLLFPAKMNDEPVKIFGPVVVGGLPRTWTISVPRMPMLDYSQAPYPVTPLFTIYDFGDNSKAGMMVAVKVHFVLGNTVAPNLGALVPRLIEKEELPNLGIPEVDLELSVPSTPLSDYCELH